MAFRRSGRRGVRRGRGRMRGRRRGGFSRRRKGSGAKRLRIGFRM